MNYIVFDLEFNQPLSKDQLIVEPFPFYHEIIQIGAVKMNEQYEITEAIDIMVKPSYYTHIGKSVRNRIGMYRGDFQKSMTFPKAYEKFLEFCGEEYCLCTWGALDIDVLNKNILIHRLTPTDNVIKCFDVQKIYFEHFGGCKNQVSLQDAIKKMKLMQYKAHNAFNDAYSAAEIFSKVKEDNNITLSNSVKVNAELFIHKDFSTKREAIKYVQECSIVCDCGNQTNIEHLIVTDKSQAIAISQCICGKEYFVVAKFLKNKSDQKIKLKCYKALMSEDLKSFYLEQTKIDHAIINYAKKHIGK